MSEIRQGNSGFNSCLAALVTEWSCMQPLKLACFFWKVFWLILFVYNLIGNSFLSSIFWLWFPPPILFRFSLPSYINSYSLFISLIRILLKKKRNEDKIQNKQMTIKTESPVKKTWKAYKCRDTYNDKHSNPIKHNLKKIIIYKQKTCRVETNKKKSKCLDKALWDQKIPKLSGYILC